MGMFDTVICKRIMPDGFDGRKVAVTDGFQTKDLERLLYVYTITRDGRLALDRTKTVEIKNPKLPFKNPKHWRNVLQNQWASTRVVKLPREYIKFTGKLNFYTYDPSRDPNLPYDETYWHEYLATFKKGKLVKIEVFDRKTQVRPINEVNKKGVKKHARKPR